MYIGSARFYPGTVTSYLKTLTQVNEDFLQMTKWKFFLYKTEVIIAVNTSKVI